MTWRRPRPIAAAVLAVICAATLCGCSVGYVLRAGYEEARILWRREPIEALLRQPQLDASTRSKLELVLAVRRFAAERLHLNVNGSFGSFARVDRDQVVHVVSAAHRLRLEPYTWWFPLLGRVPSVMGSSGVACGIGVLTLNICTVISLNTKTSTRVLPRAPRGGCLRYFARTDQ